MKHAPTGVLQGGQGVMKHASTGALQAGRA